MESKILKIIFAGILLFNMGCTKQKDKIPFEILRVYKSKNNMNVVIVKKGIMGNATVPFIYEFYFSRTPQVLDNKSLFLKVRGLGDYKVKWNSINTIELDIKMQEVLLFKSEVWKNNDLTYIVNKFNCIIE